MKRIVCLLLAIILAVMSAFVLGSCNIGEYPQDSTEVEETTKPKKETQEADEDEEDDEDDDETKKPEQTTKTDTSDADETTEFETSKFEETAESFEIADSETNFVLIRVKDYGDIVVELYPDVAPITVANFKKLVSEGFYDGLIFHRVIEGFVIQGGGYDTAYNEKDAETIKGEFSANGVENPLEHTRGVISMARTSVMDSASSQFFIMHEDAPYLDGQYAAFGKVVSGIEVVDKIAEVKTNSNDKPIEKVVINSIKFAVAK